MNEMTHYMELLSSNQPWNLILFMAIPVILAETIAVSELYILFTRNISGAMAKLNKVCSIIAGVYFTGVFIYLFPKTIIGLTASGGWRGPVDIIAVSFYLAGIVPLLGMALLELGVLGRKRDKIAKLKLHSIFVGIFLVVAHIAMIFGMLSPSLLEMKM